MTQCCDWKVDLSAEKSLSTAPPTEVGDAVAFTHTWRNAGPDRARDSVIKDKLSNPASIGVDNSTVVALTYTGGATGPATTTYGALVAGVTIPLMPAGSSVTGVFGGTAQAGFEGATLVNQTSIAPGPGHGDTNPLNNSAIEVVTLPLPCYLKCDDDLVLYTNPTQGSSFGVCFLAGTRADFTWPADNPGGSRVAFTVTNPWPTTALLEADLYAFAQAEVSSPNARFLYMHYVGPNPDPSRPTYGTSGAPIDSNFSLTNVDLANASAPMFRSPFEGAATEPSVAETGSCRWVQSLAPGASVTLYGLWKYAGQVNDSANYYLHGSYKIDVKLSRSLA